MQWSRFNDLISTAASVALPVTAAKVLALAGMDLLTDPEFRKQVRADFEKRTQGLTYKSPIPDIVKEPVGLPANMRKFGSLADLKEEIQKQIGEHEYAVPGQAHDREIDQ